MPRTIDPSTLIGTSHSYRLLYESEMRNSTVASVKTLVNIEGREKIMAVLADGHEVMASKIYFDCSEIAVASS
jgi:hypothetical protein